MRNKNLLRTMGALGTILALALAPVLLFTGGDARVDAQTGEDATPTPTPTPGLMPEGDEPGVTQDMPPPDQVPEQTGVAPFPEVAPEDVVGIEEVGSLAARIHLLDAENGESRGFIDISDDSESVVPVFAQDVPLAVAVEEYRSRYSRGELDAMVTFFNQEATVAEEVDLDRLNYQQAGMSEDGTYFYVFDEHLYGVGVLDVQQRSLVGEVETIGCGPDFMPVGSDRLYLACWESGEIVEVSAAGGDVSADNRAQAFPPGALLHPEFTFARDTDTIYLFTWNSEVIPISLENGLPNQPIEPVSLEREGLIIAEEIYVVAADGSRAYVGYTEGVDYEEPATEIVVYDNAWSELGVMTLPEEGEVDDVALSNDGSRLYVLFSEGERMAIFDTQSMQMTSEVELPGEFDSLFTPWVLE